MRPARAVASRVYHALVLLADGGVVGWGPNERGQLGDGTRKHRRAPAHVRGLDGAVGVAAGVSHSLALREDGSVVARGDNAYGMRAIVAGPNNSFAVLAHGQVVGWASAPATSSPTHGYPTGRCRSRGSSARPNVNGRHRGCEGRVLT